MLINLMRVVLICTVAICMSAATVLAVGTPDPGMSTVDDLLLTCPAGDINFQVVVLDDTGTPCSGALVALDFCNCDEAILCLYAGGSPCGNGKNDLLFATTNANGVAVFSPPAGGICGGAMVDIVADGVLLAQRNVLAMDVNGNFLVEMTDFTFDPVLNDYNGDGVSNLVDNLIWSNHAAIGHFCDAPVSSENQTWGGIKTLWR